MGEEVADRLILGVTSRIRRGEGELQYLHIGNVPFSTPAFNQYVNIKCKYIKKYVVHTCTLYA